MLYKGFYQGVMAVTPYGYLRSLTLRIGDEDKTLQVGFKKIEQETKKLKHGDLIEVEYDNYDNFTIRKL